MADWLLLRAESRGPIEAAVIGDKMTNDAQSKWTYTEIEVLDANRLLRPTHICATEIRFTEPPSLTSEFITIITRNGNRNTHHRARILTHQADATRIPIELLPLGSAPRTSTKLTA